MTSREHTQDVTAAHSAGVTLNPTAVPFGEYVDGHGALRLVLHEDANDAYRWKVTGHCGERLVAEEFSHAPTLFRYIAALIEAWHTNQTSPPPPVVGWAAADGKQVHP